MGAAIQAVVDWAGDPGAILAYETRFARPVTVPFPGAARLEVTATVAEVDRAAGQAGIVLTVTRGDVRVLAKARATVRLPAGARPEAGRLPAAPAHPADSGSGRRDGR
jgi:ferric-dicitrate binding protein FerR (iron transport regulator)